MYDEKKEDFEMRGQFTPDNSALVLIDYQVGTLQLNTECEFRCIAA